MKTSGDYYTSMESLFERNKNNDSPLANCPKCKGPMKEIYNLRVDGTPKKNNKIVDLVCKECNYALSSVRQPKNKVI